MLKKLYGKMVNPETVSYLIFGVLTTAVDWIGLSHIQMDSGRPWRRPRSSAGRRL